MKRYTVVPTFERNIKVIENEKGLWVDAEIAQELYDHLKHAVNQGQKILDGKEPDGNEDFENWFLSARKALEKAEEG